MDSVYYLMMLIGMGWICAWAALPKPDPGFGWWPFDMAQDDPKRGGTDSADGRGGGVPAGRPPHPWRGRVPRPAGPKPAAEPAGRTARATTAEDHCGWRRRAQRPAGRGRGRTR